jgi:hypothetical protein
MEMGFGWWFGTFLIFPYLGNDPNLLSHFSEGEAQPPTRDGKWEDLITFVHHISRHYINYYIMVNNGII